MAHIFELRVLETTTTTGTGAKTLAGAVTGYRTFGSVMATNDVCWYYCEAVDASGNATGDYEAGLGTYNSTGPTLTNTTVLRSSNADAAVNFAAGTKRVGLTLVPQRLLELDNEIVARLPQSSVATPAVPAANVLNFYSRNRAGRMFFMVQGPSGLDTALQPALFGNNVAMWMAGTGTTVAINFGVNWTARNSGTGAAQSHPALATTNALTQMKRARFGTGTTTTGSSGIQSGAQVAWRGNASGLGGFFFFARFGIDTAESAMQFMIGLSALNAALAGEPSAQNNTICIGADSGDANIQIIERNGSTATKTSTGVSKTTTGAIYDFMMFAPPNGSSVICRMVNPVTGTVHVDNVTFNTTLPVNTTFLYAHCQIRSTAGATAKNLDLNRIYVESDT